MGEQQARVAVVVGYFDWFSGYQETALAAALSKLAEVEVIASDRVNPTFTDSHLQRLGIPRRYRPGSTREHGVLVTRYCAIELRSMVWSGRASRYLGAQRYDLVVQVMPGQLFAVAATLARNPAPRVVLYGDNKAMWNNLATWQRLVKGSVFAATKGVLYTAVNAGASATYGYTPDTVRRLRPFRAGRPCEVMPLAFSPERFYVDAGLRRQFRGDLGLADNDIVVVAAGKFEPQKRLDWLVSAYASIAADRPEVHLVLVGADSSTGSAQIDELARTSPYRDRMHVRPFTDAAGLNAVFNGADLGVWPRNPAITIQQAMGAGLPVLLPRNDLVGHLVKAGSGHYFDLVETRGGQCLTDGLGRALDQTDFSDNARRRRAATNGWLGADHVARDLLAHVRGSNDVTV